MSTMEQVLPVKIPRTLLWWQYLLDSLLAFVGSMLITGCIALWQLYPRIPNISIIYLLVVLTLASTRGRYAATLASLVAFLSFDYFLVPPLYVFTINRVEEWIALFIFLVTAILTSQLAVALRNQAQQARTREQQTRILYGEHARLQQENMRIEVLQRTDALRAALLSSVSHDLRTPLTSIKAAASSLLQRNVHWDEEEQRGFAQAIEHEADRLNRLVGNLLDMSRIEDGALRPEKEEYSLVALVQDVLGRLEPLLADRLVCTHLPSDLLLVDVDYLHLDQVLTNLIENAVRYTPPESPIDVCARCAEEQIILSVADRGPGVPPAEIRHIFDKFYRVERGRNGRQVPPSLTSPSAPLSCPMGSGLGLAVCKGLVEANGGHVQAELREGGGLVVSVTLPKSKQERIDE